MTVLTTNIASGMSWAERFIGYRSLGAKPSAELSTDLASGNLRSLSFSRSVYFLAGMILGRRGVQTHYRAPGSTTLSDHFVSQRPVAELRTLTCKEALQQEIRCWRAYRVRPAAEATVIERERPNTILSRATSASQPLARPLGICPTAR